MVTLWYMLCHCYVSVGFADLYGYERSGRVATVRTTADDEAEWEEVADWAAELNEKYLECRRYGHNWRPWAADWISAQRLFEDVARCSRCLTRRLELITEYGDVYSSQYVYADGYQHKGHGRITGRGRGALRVASIQRTREKRREKGGQ